MLFPLLDRVKRLSSLASASRDESSSAHQGGVSNSGGGANKTSVNILMHHSRDTAEKQWAETRFLTLGGVTRVFSLKCGVLKQLSEYTEMYLLGRFYLFYLDLIVV